MALHLGLESDALRVLRGLKLQTRQRFRGASHGERMARQRGVSIEFRDHREYGEGDDLRHMDWNALARLDNAVIKTYRDEQETLVSLWVDQSASMEFGSLPKVELARQLACALGIAALQGGDTVRVTNFGSTQPSATIRGIGQAGRMAAMVAQPPTKRDAALATGMKAGLAALPRPGAVIIVSDGLDPDVARLITAIGGRRSEPFFVQILAPEELDPELEGDLRLIDSESGGVREITANRAAVAQYRDNLQAHIDSIAAATTRAGGRHVLVTSTQSAREVIQTALIKQGWLR